MYNADKPNREDLPSSAQLIRSTLLALVAALILLVTIILPAEYGYDPTRIGRLLGLAEMGEIKQQLAREAEEDHGRAADTRPGAFATLLGEFVLGTARANTPGSPQGESWTDEVVFTLEPSKGTEIKLVMEKGARADFAWTAEGGRVNYDLHADGEGDQEMSYRKGRGVSGDAGVIEAAFTGNHGWYWRNRDAAPVPITLRVRGDYSELKRLD
ncbi:MAG: transmembrane anchor protein [Alphaproteobacteria bacterium]|nr:transmembrane anchor protein [Alphaproteobacteria bacterium]